MDHACIQLAHVPELIDDAAHNLVIENQKTEALLAKASWVIADGISQQTIEAEQQDLGLSSLIAQSNTLHQ